MDMSYGENVLTDGMAGTSENYLFDGYWKVGALVRLVFDTSREVVQSVGKLYDTLRTTIYTGWLTYRPKSSLDQTTVRLTQHEANWEKFQGDVQEYIWNAIKQQQSEWTRSTEEEV